MMKAKAMQRCSSASRSRLTGGRNKNRISSRAYFKENIAESDKAIIISGLLSHAQYLHKSCSERKALRFPFNEKSLEIDS
jgi:hypothetical protein